MFIGIQVRVRLRNKLIIIAFVLGVIQKKVAFGVYGERTDTRDTGAR